MWDFRTHFSQHHPLHVAICNLNGGVRRCVPVEVVPLHNTLFVRQRGHIDDARTRSCLLHKRHHQVGEQEVAEVIGADLHLKTILRPGERADHHAGVVDQDVEIGNCGLCGKKQKLWSVRQNRFIEIFFKKYK